MDTEAIYALIKQHEMMHGIYGPPGIPKSGIIEDYCLNHNIPMMQFKIKGDKGMAKYSIIKDISGRIILQDDPCNGEYDKFVKRFGYFEHLTQSDIDSMVDEGQDVWIEWLEDNGYITRYNTNIRIKKPNDHNGYTIWHAEDDPTCFQIYYNGTPVSSGHLFFIEIDHDGVIKIKRCGGVTLHDMPKCGLDISDGYVNIKLN